MSEDSVARRVFAVASRVVVLVRRSRIEASRVASCSVVHASAAFCGGVWLVGEGSGRVDSYLQGVVDDLFP